MKERIERIRERELAYLSGDLAYFIESYCKIEDKDATEAVIPFKLWPEQKKALASIHEHKFNIVLKARQLGMSWLAICYALYTLMTREGSTVVALSRTELEAKELVRRLGVIVRNMPEFFSEYGPEPPGGFRFEATAMTIKIFKKGNAPSIFQAFNSAPGVSRSFTANLLLFDEWAFQQYAEEIWTAGLPVINRPGGGKVIGLSTMMPGTFFEKTWKQAEEFNRIFLPWDADPRRDAAWYRKTRKLLGEKTLREYPASPEEAMATFEGAYFDEMRRDIHVCEPFAIPDDWRRYHTMDYGLDMLASYWVAFDGENNAYVYREVYEEGLIIPKAAEAMKQAEQGEAIYLRYAPPDMFGRSNESGRTRAEIFDSYGLHFERSSNDRISGWANLKEWLQVYTDPEGKETARLKIFKNCPNLIRTLQSIARDKKKPNDCANEPHELTHAPDALRYLFVLRPFGAKPKENRKTKMYYSEVESLLSYGT